MPGTMRMRRRMSAALASLLIGAVITVSAQEGSRAGLTPAEKDFVASAAMGANYQVAAAKVALAKSKSDVVRRYAEGMITDHTAMQLITVFGSVSFIANGISLLPVDVYRDNPDGTQDELKSPSWMDQANPDLSGSEFRNQFVVSLLLDGNFYCIPVRNSQGLTLEVWPLHPRDVQVLRLPGQRPEYWVYGQRLQADQIVHVVLADVPALATAWDARQDRA